MNSTTTPIAIRVATPDDSVDIVRLATLDSAQVPFGRTLVASVGDELVAALPLDGGRAFADPFRRTAEIVQLLELRAKQLPAGERAGRFASVLHLGGARRRAVAAAR